MNFFRSFLFNFLIVFFVDWISPGVEIVYFSGVKDIGSEFIFSLLVGFLNASICPILFGLQFKVTVFRLALLTFAVSYASFILIAYVPFGIRANVVGVLIGGTLVWVMALITNYLEWRHLIHPPE